MSTRFLRRRLSFAAGAFVALAACLWIFSASAALAQNADSNLQASVSGALSHDAMLKNQPITASIANGVVTLSGTVDTEQQRQAAETDAVNVPGVSGIQNNITVTGSSTETPNAPPADQVQQVPPPPPADGQQPAAAPNMQQVPPPPPPDQPGAPAQPATPRTPYPQGGYAQQPYGGYGNYPPPQPTSGPITIPAGTLLQIRISEPLDIAKLQDGAVFQATAASDVFEGNVLAIPRGAVLQGTVVKVKKPGALGGSGELQLQIGSVNLAGRTFPLVTDTWSSTGPNKAGYTAGNTVGGAAIGALIGGILGRGAGAAVGAAVGGGAGLAASAGTNGPRLYLPPETMLNFHLSNAVTVQPVSWQEAQRLEQSAPRLQRRPVYMAPPYPYGYPYPYPYRVYGW